MRILYVNKSFSGQMEQFARFIAQKKASTSVFMAERWLRDAQLPGGMLVRIPAAEARNLQGEHSEDQLAQNLVARMMHNAFAVKKACLRLKQNGFLPDIIYTTSQDGYGLLLQDVFPKARLVARLDWVQVQRYAFATPEASSGLASSASNASSMSDSSNSSSNPSSLSSSISKSSNLSLGAESSNILTRLSAQERLSANFQLALLCACDQGITSSDWQKSQLPKELGQKISVVENGVNTQFFVPDVVPSSVENIVFSCQGRNAARGINIIVKSLPGLLTLRPNCHIYIVSFASRKSETGKLQHAKELSSLLPCLTEAQQKRVSLVPSPSALKYRNLLQQARIYVYLTAPTLLSAGLMEAMSCGTLVLASDTDPVREIIAGGKNGLLWSGKDAESLAFEVSEACARSTELQTLKQPARETILARYEIRNVLLHHAKILLGDFA